MRRIIRYKEFWFALALIALILLFASAVFVYNNYGNYWVATLRGEEVRESISDGRVYAVFTRKIFIECAIWVTWFLVFLALEIYHLLKRKATGISLQAPLFLFLIAIAPLSFNLIKGFVIIYFPYLIPLK